MIMVKKQKGARITANVEGVERATIPLKAVVYFEEEREIKILAETVLEKDEFKLDLKVAAEDLPERSKVVIIPQEVTSHSLIRRLTEADHVPQADIYRDEMLAREGKLTAADIALKPVDDLIPFWRLKHRVCGRVIKRNPVTGEACPVPGATVRVLDVDYHLWWWHPYPGLPWTWLFPIWPTREEIATTSTDKCGNFCVDIPYLDIDAILRWRLRYRCLWENLQLPRVIDAIDLGIKPDPQVYKELEHLPELTPKPKPWPPWPDPGPLASQEIIHTMKHCEETAETSSNRPTAQSSAAVRGKGLSDLYTQPQFEMVRNELFGKGMLFEPTETTKSSVLEQPAFPHSIPSPALPDDETILKHLPNSKMLSAIHDARPLVRLLRCWPEIVPEWHLMLDVPDIVFKVEQDVDNDGTLETIYDQGYMDVNWNLSKPTTNVVIEAQANAICVPCGPPYTPCTTSGIVGISEMPVDSAYLDGNGYAVRVNRPKPNGVRPAAKTPFCKTIRLVGCPGYGQASYYKVFYSYEGQAETHFDESWWIYQISTGTSQKVVPDANGFYPALTPANDFFPYHTLINWCTYNYPNGTYTLRLGLYNASHNPIGPALPAVKLVLDNSRPSRVDFLKLEYREVGGTWKPVTLHCPIIHRPHGKDIQLRIRYNVAATHLRNLVLSFTGCGGSVGSTGYWHKAVNDNNINKSWIVDVPATTPEGGYRFYLEGRSRAFTGVGGLASNWYFDPLYIWRGNNLHVVILDS